MSTQRLFAMILIFAAASGAWMILGQTIEYRTASLNDSLRKEVQDLWGPADVVQQGPTFVAADLDRAQLLRADVKADFDHANRYKGLLWFSTYTARFTGTYDVAVGTAPGKTADKPATFLLALPETLSRIDDLKVHVDGKEIEPGWSPGSRHELSVLLEPAGKPHTVSVSYQTQGRDRWTYAPILEAGGPGGMIRDLSVTLKTNFKEIDYPAGSVSPTSPARPVAGGMEALWKSANTRSRLVMGIEMPKRPNAGPVAARMSFFAPVSLLFFFTALFTVVVLKKLALHPMHYLFIAAGFFAFHILLSYLVDIMNIHAAFWICAAVSVFLVVSYMRLVGGIRFAATYVALAQLVYLVGFSYAFFWAGRTGLTITVGAIATLFVLMQATGKVNWHTVFARPALALPPAFTPPPVPSPNTPRPTV